MSQEITSLIEVLTGLIKTLQQQQVSGTSDIKEALKHQIINFETFDETQENFDTYCQRLENFFNLKGISGNNTDINEAKVMVLINCLGSKYYKLLSTLTSPDLPTTKTYPELITLLKNHLAPKNNILTEQHKFFTRKQNQYESISSYIAALKELAKTCDFKTHCNTPDCNKFTMNLLLRAQFIRGLLDNDIREKILQEADITLDKALQMALAIEASKIQNREIYNNSNFSDNVNKVDSRYKFSRKRNKSRAGRSTSKSRNQNLDLQKLGLDGLCLHCGRNNHQTRECRVIKKLRCRDCKKPGHISKVCISTLLSNSKTKHSVQTVEHEISTDEEFSINQIIDIFHESSSPVFEPKIMIDLKIQDKKFTFECDTGSPVSIISQKDYGSLHLDLPLKETNIQFRSYTRHIFKPLGYVEVPVTFNDKKISGDLYIVPNYGSAILGRRWLRKLNINIHEVNEISVESTIKNILQNFKDVFTPEVGKIPDFQCSLRLKPDAKPVFLKPRRIPYALQEEVEKELDSLEKEGIIQKTDHSEWGTPLVIVPKSNGKVRLCADYKVTLNQQIQDNRYPIPKIEDIFNKMENGKYFCTLDIFKAYLHVPVDEDSAKYQAISTHRGSYLAKRLFFGIKTAPNEFHKIIDQIVGNLEGTIVYFDDILIQGATFEKCKIRLIKVLETLRKYNLHLNPEKCRFFEKQIKYLGHVISKNGLQKSTEKIVAIQNAPRPKNVEEVQQFLGMVRYYDKFIPDASSILEPLNNLLRKNSKFRWTDACETAFQRAKDEIISDRVLMPFTPEYEVILATDASPYGLSAVLSHKLPDGSERPVLFISRSLTKAEKNYSQLDREATAIYWAFKKLFHYLYGRKFTLVVDNKPLTTIFNPSKQLPVLSATRMIRYAQFLSGFDYIIQYKKSSEHQNADYFSRNPLKLDKKEENFIDDEYIQNIQQIDSFSTDCLNAKTIAEETRRDSELSEIKGKILNGKIRDPEFSLQEDIIFRGQRVVIPRKLQNCMLKELHSTHIGMVKMKQLARRYCYWKGIDNDIENLVRSCRPCSDIHKNPPKAPIHQWEKPLKNWQRVHIDYAGPFMNHHFFIAVDAKSKWPEIRMSKSAPTTTETINYLREMCSRFGLPEFLVSDNASIFKSKEFLVFCKRNGIKQNFIAPGHPATNGQAERYCQTLKSKLKRMANEPGSLHEKLHAFLFKYRITPLSCGKSPSEIMFGYNIRTKLDLIRPQTRCKNNAAIPKCKKTYKVGSRVQSRNYFGTLMWKYGTITKQLGKLHFLVQLDDGRIIKRHINQLRSSDVSKPLHSTLPSSKGFSNQSTHYHVPEHGPIKKKVTFDFNIPVTTIPKFNRMIASTSVNPEPQHHSAPLSPAPSQEPEYEAMSKSSTSEDQPNRPVRKLNL